MMFSVEKVRQDAGLQSKPMKSVQMEFCFTKVNGVVKRTAITLVLVSGFGYQFAGFWYQFFVMRHLFL